MGVSLAKVPSAHDRRRRKTELRAAFRVSPNRKALVSAIGSRYVVSWHR